MNAAPLRSQTDARPAPAPPPDGRRGVGFVRRVVTRLHDWAESGWSGSAMATWGVLQGSVVPGPADGLLIPLGLADPRRAYRLALWALAGSIAGGFCAYLLGAHAFDSAGATLLSWMGVGAAQLQSSRALFDRYGGAIVALSALIPIPTKMMCIAAGAFGVPFPEFAVGIALGRGIRFMAVATALRYAGEGLGRWLRRRLGVTRGATAGIGGETM